MKFRVLLPILTATVLAPLAHAEPWGIPGPPKEDVKLETDLSASVSKRSGEGNLLPGGKLDYRLRINHNAEGTWTPTFDLGLGFVGKRFVGNGGIGIAGGGRSGVFGLGGRADFTSLTLSGGPVLSAGIGPEKANLNLDVVPFGGIMDRENGATGATSSAQLSGSLGLGQFAQLYGSAKGALLWPGMGARPAIQTIQTVIDSKVIDGKTITTTSEEKKVNEKGIPNSDKTGTSVELTAGVKIPLKGEKLHIKAEAVYQKVNYKTGTGPADQFDSSNESIERKNLTGSVFVGGAF